MHEAEEVLLNLYETERRFAGSISDFYLEESRNTQANQVFDRPLPLPMSPWDCLQKRDRQ